MRKLLLVGFVIFGLVALGGCGGGFLGETKFEELEGTRTLKSGSGTMTAIGYKADFTLTLENGFVSTTVKNIATDNTQATCDIHSFIRWKVEDKSIGFVTYYDLDYSGTNLAVKRTGDDTFSYTFTSTKVNSKVELNSNGNTRETGVVSDDFGKFAYDVNYSTK